MSFGYGTIPSPSSSFLGGLSGVSLPGYGYPQGQAPTPFPYTSPPQPTSFSPSQNYMGGAETGAYTGLGAMGPLNTYAAGLPSAWGITNNLISGGGPGAGFMQGASWPAANMGMTAAGNQFGAAPALYGAGGSLMGAGGNVLNTAFDPQNQLYQQYQNLTTDQARANASAAGLGTTPIGASSVDWANNNFNLNWANAQLQRQIAGLGAAGGAYQGAGGLFGQAAGMQAGAAPLFMQSASYPWQTGQQIGGANLGTLGQFGALGAGASGQQATTNQQYLNYLMQTGALQQAGNAANLNAYNAMLSGQQQAFGQGQVSQFQDPNQLMSQYNQLMQMQFKNQMAQNQQAMEGLGGIGNLAGMLGTAAILA